MRLAGSFGLADEDLARATGANIRTVRRWREGRLGERRTKYDARLETLESVLRVLRGEDPSFVTAWLRSPDNPALNGGNALDMICEGKFASVVLGAQATFAGSATKTR